MAENLKAFESLKENENASLSSKEKDDLRKISPDDIKDQKENVGEKSFVVDGKPMKLKDIVKNLTFDEEGEKAELKINGKKVAIGWQSELGAAIQVYAIAHNKTIGRAGIDGKVGRESIKGLQETQTEAKVTNQQKPSENVKESDETTSRLYDLLRSDYRYKVGKYNDQKYNLLNTTPGETEGALRYAVRNGTSEEISIKYKSAIDGKFQTIKIDAGKCKEGNNYSANKFGKAIENAISKKESDLRKAENDRINKENLNRRQEYIIKAAENFNIRTLDKKNRRYLEDKNYVLNNHLNPQAGFGTGIKFNEIGELKFGNAFTLTKNEVNQFYVNGIFKEGSFKNTLNKKLNTISEKYYGEKARNLANNLDKVSVTVGSVDYAKKGIDIIEKQINEIGDLITIPTDVSDKLKNKKELLKNMSDFSEVSKGMENILKDIETQITKKMSPVETKNIKDKVIRIDKGLTEKWYAYNSKNVHTVYSKITGGEEKYKELAKRVKNIKEQIF